MSISLTSPRPLRLLALETSTNRLSVAVGSKQPQQPWRQWVLSGEGGSQSSATLIPAVQDLLQQAQLTLGQLHAIVVGIGPGSFTGLRTACSVAQGLALGAGLPVLPVSTLLAVAEEWRHKHAATVPTGCVWALLDARMDEIYAACWQWQMTDHAQSHTQNYTQWQCLHADALVKPEDLHLLPQVQDGTLHFAGNVQAVYGDRLGHFVVTPALPTAGALLRLAPALLQQGRALDPAQVLPHYVRNKVGQTTAEREAEKAKQ